MATYKLTASEKIVVRTGTVKPNGDIGPDVWIPDDPDNSDWIEYQEWLAAGGVPDPAPTTDSP